MLVTAPTSTRYSITSHHLTPTAAAVAALQLGLLKQDGWMGKSRYVHWVLPLDQHSSS
jgi:hypothetical protein